MFRKLFGSIIIAATILLNSIGTIDAGDPAISSRKIDEKFIQAKNAELFCKIIGSGDPLIVIHGGAGYITHDYLLPHMEPIADNNLVVFYDQRGLGRSTGEIIPEQVNIKTFIEDIDAIRSFLGAKKISLLGHSWGGFLAMHYAISYPESIDKLILLSSQPASFKDLGLFFTELEKRIAPYQEELKRIESSESFAAGDPQTVENHLKIFFRTYMHSPENVGKLNLWKSRNAALNGFKVWKIFEEHVFMKPHDLTDHLSTLRCKTLIIHGDSDPIPFSTAENHKAAIPSSKLIKIRQCGHFPFVEQPDEVFKAIKDFLD